MEVFLRNLDERLEFISTELTEISGRIQSIVGPSEDELEAGGKCYREALIKARTVLETKVATVRDFTAAQKSLSDRVLADSKEFIEVQERLESTEGFLLFWECCKELTSLFSAFDECLACQDYLQCIQLLQRIEDHIEALTEGFDVIGDELEEYRVGILKQESDRLVRLHVAVREAFATMVTIEEGKIRIPADREFINLVRAAAELNIEEEGLTQVIQRVRAVLLEPLGDGGQNVRVVSKNNEILLEAEPIADAKRTVILVNTIANLVPALIHLLFDQQPERRTYGDRFVTHLTASIGDRIGHIGNPDEAIEQLAYTLDAFDRLIDLWEGKHLVDEEDLLYKIRKDIARKPWGRVSEAFANELEAVLDYQRGGPVEMPDKFKDAEACEADLAKLCFLPVDSVVAHWSARQAEKLKTYLGFRSPDEAVLSTLANILRPNVERQGAQLCLFSSALWEFLIRTGKLNRFSSGVHAEAETVLESKVMALLVIKMPLLGEAESFDGVTSLSIIDMLADVCTIGGGLLLIDLAVTLSRGHHATPAWREELLQKLRERAKKLHQALITKQWSAARSRTDYLDALVARNGLNDAEADAATEISVVKGLVCECLRRLPWSIGGTLGCELADTSASILLERFWNTLRAMRLVTKPSDRKDQGVKGLLNRARKLQLIGHLSAAVEEAQQVIGGGGGWNLFDHPSSSHSLPGSSDLDLAQRAANSNDPAGKLALLLQRFRHTLELVVAELAARDQSDELLKVPELDLLPKLLEYFGAAKPIPDNGEWTTEQVQLLIFANPCLLQPVDDVTQW